MQQPGRPRHAGQHYACHSTADVLQQCGRMPAQEWDTPLAALCRHAIAKEDDVRLQYASAIGTWRHNETLPCMHTWLSPSSSSHLDILPLDHPKANRHWISTGAMRLRRMGCAPASCSSTSPSGRLTGISTSPSGLRLKSCACTLLAVTQRSSSYSSVDRQHVLLFEGTAFP